MQEIYKFIYRIFKFTSLQVSVLLLFLAPQILNYEEVIYQSFLAATIDKHSLLNRQIKRRILFVGGSAFAFGNDSSYIGEQLNYYPINMGLHGGLGVEYQLNEVKDKLQSGDIVVLSIEYESFIDFPPSSKEVFSVLEPRWQNIKFLPLNYIPSMLDKGLVITGEVLRRSLASFTGDIERKSYLRRDGFNEFGDLVAHHQLESLAEKVSTDNKTYSFELNDVRRAIKSLNYFNKIAKEKGVKVFYAYPPLLKRVLDKSRTEIRVVEKELSQSLEFPILDKPEDVAYPENHYFDTRYHLNKIGIEKRSKHLSERLSGHINSTEK